MAARPDALGGLAQSPAVVLNRVLPRVPRDAVQSLDALRSLDVRPSQGGLALLDRWGRCAWDAWDGVRRDEAPDANPARSWNPAFAGGDAQKLRGH